MIRTRGAEPSKDATYRAMILCLNSLYREELSFIASIKHRYPHIEIWLSQTDGRAAALAEALRLGADGLMSEDGPHRFAMTEELSGGGNGEKAQAAGSGEQAGGGTGAPQVKAGARPEGERCQAVCEGCGIADGDPVLTAMN